MVSIDLPAETALQSCTEGGVYFHGATVVRVTQKKTCDFGRSPAPKQKKTAADVILARARTGSRAVQMDDFISDFFFLPSALELQLGMRLPALERRTACLNGIAVGEVCARNIAFYFM